MKKIHSNHIITFLLFFFSFTVISVEAQNQKKSEPQQKPLVTGDSLTKANFTYKIINSPNKSFGYDIYCDNKLMIHQPKIPGLPGNDGFKTNRNAKTIAELVITKIKKGEMPPTVTIEEMKKLNAIK